MKWNIINQPTGGFPVGGPTKKEMPVPLAIPLVMAAGSALSSVFGGISSAKANKRAMRQIAAERAKNEAERLRKTNEDYIDTAAGQNLMRVARREADKMWKREKGAAAVTGATERAAMAKDRGNELIADTVAGIAANDTARKDQIDQTYKNYDQQLSQQLTGLDLQKGQNIAQAASGVSNSLMDAAGAAFGGTSLGQQWFGAGSPGGGGVTPSLNKMGIWDEYGQIPLYSSSMLYTRNPRQFFGL